MGLRTREVRPGFWDNEELGELSHTARLLWIGLWSYADREGRFEARLGRIQGNLFRYDLNLDVSAPFQELVDHGFVVLYEAEGRALGYIPNFKKHQRIHPRETKSELPEPPRLALGAPRCAGPSEPSEPSEPSYTKDPSIDISSSRKNTTAQRAQRAGQSSIGDCLIVPEPGDGTAQWLANVAAVEREIDSMIPWPLRPPIRTRIAELVIDGDIEPAELRRIVEKTRALDESNKLAVTHDAFIVRCVQTKLADAHKQHLWPSHQGNGRTPNAAGVPS